VGLFIFKAVNIEDETFSNMAEMLRCRHPA